MNEISLFCFLQTHEAFITLTFALWERFIMLAATEYQAISKS